MNTYRAWVQNDQGAHTKVDLSDVERHNKRACADAARQQFGRGWTVHIEQIDEATGYVEEVDKFTIK